MTASARQRGKTLSHAEMLEAYLGRATTRYQPQASVPVRETSLMLPWPPSVNGYWRSIVAWQGKRPSVQVKISREGREYRKAVRRIVLEGGAERLVNGRYAVTITAYPPDRRKRDLDNLPKAVLDALQDAGVFEDDSLIDDLRILRDWSHVERAGLSVRARVISGLDG